MERQPVWNNSSGCGCLSVPPALWASTSAPAAAASSAGSPVSILVERRPLSSPLLHCLGWVRLIMQRGLLSYGPGCLGGHQPDHISLTEPHQPDISSSPAHAGITEASGGNTTRDSWGMDMIMYVLFFIGVCLCVCVCTCTCVNEWVITDAVVNAHRAGEFHAVVYNLLGLW